MRQVSYTTIQIVFEEFEEAIKQLEDNTQAELDAWNEKQQDYAMDNMTCDIAEEVYENM